MGRRRRARGRPVHGILLLDKPGGVTSNRALQIARRLYDANKAGHTGSLDPAATGMLPVCFGEATKVSGYLLDADKEYLVTAAIGQRTDTADADGEVIETAAVDEVTAAQLDTAVAEFQGVIEQVPPMYSALKKDGRRLYELARKGEEVERQPRQVTIHELEVTVFDPTRPQLRVRCSKGTYIRTLVEDIAAAMGTLAHVAALRRTSVDPFAGRAMVSLDQLESLSADAAPGDKSALDALLLPPDSALQAYPELLLAANEAFYLGHGHAVTVPQDTPEGPVRLYDDGGRLLGMGEVRDGLAAPKRLFPGL